MFFQFPFPRGIKNAVFFQFPFPGTIENAVFFQFPFPGAIENAVFFQFPFPGVIENAVFFQSATMSFKNNSNDNAVKVNDKAQWTLNVFMSSTICSDDTKLATTLLFV